VTIAALLVCGILAIFASFTLFFLSPGYVFFCFFAFYLMPPLVLKKLVGAKNNKSPLASNSNAVIEPDERLRSGGPLSQALAVGLLAARSPSLAVNIFRRVPTDDELGHRCVFLQLFLLFKE